MGEEGERQERERAEERWRDRRRDRERVVSDWLFFTEQQYSYSAVLVSPSTAVPDKFVLITNYPVYAPVTPLPLTGAGRMRIVPQSSPQRPSSGRAGRRSRAGNVWARSFWRKIFRPTSVLHAISAAFGALFRYPNAAGHNV